MHVAVMGAGSLGSLIGGLLATTHRVTLVGREPHMRAIASEGLHLSGAVDRTVHPATTTSWSALDAVDVALVTVKSYDTLAAATAMRANPPSVVISLQNGLDTTTPLRDGIGHRPEILAGTATYGALLEEPGHVQCTGQGTIVFGKPDGGRSSSAEQLAASWGEAVDCRATTAMPQRRWEKVATNAGINPITALSGVRNGRVLDDPLWPIATAATREVTRVARSRGHDLEEHETVARLKTVAQQTAENESSMARDVRTGSQTEIDAITGAVLTRAAQSVVPVNRVLYGLIAGYEMGAGIRDSS